MSPGGKARVSLATGVLCLAALISGCGGSSGGTEGDPVDRESLDGRTFTSTEITGRELVPGTEVSISFEGDRINATAGCNSMFGGFELEAGRLTAPMLGTTQMGCDPERHSQDRWLSEFLAEGAAIDRDGNELTLTGDDAAINFREQGDGEPDVAGITWELGILTGADGEPSGVPHGRRQATLEISGDGYATWTSGCNGGGGTVDIKPGAIVFERASWTEMLCRGPVMKVERAMQKVFNGEAAMATGPGQRNLILRRKGISLTFRPR